MKTIYKTLLVATILTPALTGCLEETFPTDGATTEQLQASAKAAEALVWGMPAFMNNVGTISDDYHYDWGQGSLMGIRDIMTEDLLRPAVGYNWYTTWMTVNVATGEDYAATQFIWNYYNQQVLASNGVLKTLTKEAVDGPTKAYRGYALAFRASTYLDMGRMYEFLENDALSGQINDTTNVTGLTVPIVTEFTTEEQARNNPRAPHAELAAFIKADLDEAEELLQGAAVLSKTLPSLAVVYGLQARLAMWNEDYATAATYAQKAIAEHGGRPMNEEEWCSPTAGFNTLSTSSWMWGSQNMKEDRTVTSGIINWASWNSNEANYGYAYAGATLMIDAKLYNSISDDDFRKYTFVAPEGTNPKVVAKVQYANTDLIGELEPYSSLKFRPGEGNCDDYTVGSASAYPLMRLEEMYFIKAEAEAHSNPAQGLQTLKDFMVNYRNPYYTTSAAGQEAVIKEIILQKRIELFGEGQIFFDYKRLNMPVNRAYSGSNWPSTARFVTSTRPAWMNFVIVKSEGTNNVAVTNCNNPDPEGAYTVVQ